jgi:hypothetical protein
LWASPIRATLKLVVRREQRRLEKLPVKRAKPRVAKPTKQEPAQSAALQAGGAAPLVAGVATKKQKLRVVELQTASTNGSHPDLTAVSKAPKEKKLKCVHPINPAGVEDA